MTDINKSVALKIGVSVNEASAEYDKLKKKADDTKTSIDDVAKSSSTVFDKLKNSAKQAEAALNGVSLEQKAESVKKVAEGLVGGFQAASGAIAVFGVNTQAVTVAMEKAQAAFLITDGIKKVTEGIGQMGTAFNTLKKIILANPLLSFLTAAVAITAGIYALVKAEDEETEAINNQIKANKDRFDAIEAGYEREIALARAAGKETGELEKGKLKAVYDRISRELELEKLKYEKEEQLFKSLLGGGKFADQQAAKARVTAENEAYNKILKLKYDLDKAKNDLEVKEIENNKKKNDNLLKSNKEYADNLKAQREKEAAQRKKDIDDELAFQEYTTQKAIEARQRLLDEFDLVIKNFKEQFDQEALSPVASIDDAALEKRASFEKDLLQGLLDARKRFGDESFNVAQAGLDSLSQIVSGNEKLSNAIFITEKAVAIGKIVVDTIKANAAATAAQVTKISEATAIPGGEAFIPGIVAEFTAIRNANRLAAAGSIASIAATTLAKFKSGSGGGSSALGASSGGASGGGGGSIPTPPPPPNAPGNQSTLLKPGDETVRSMQPVIIQNKIVATEIMAKQDEINSIKNKATIS